MKGARRRGERRLPSEPRHPVRGSDARACRIPPSRAQAPPPSRRAPRRAPPRPVASGTRTSPWPRAHHQRRRRGGCRGPPRGSRSRRDRIQLAQASGFGPACPARYAQVAQARLRDPPENGSGEVAAVVANRRARRARRRRRAGAGRPGTNPDERRGELVHRVLARRRVDLLRRGGLARDAEARDRGLDARCRPSSVTAMSISATIRASRGCSTSRRTCDVPSRTVSPRASVTLRTRTGSSSRPPFAIAAIAIASCSVVTLMPCPNDALAVSTSNQGRPAAAGPRWPPPGSGKPVGSPNPKRRNAE